MSSVSIQGNASGTGIFTIASPNSNTNRTLTLPDSTGTVLVSGGSQSIEFAAGSSSAPSITTTGDTNTGIFFPAADTIAFTEGGVESMRVDSSGNLGLGTSSPDARLHVSGTTTVARLQSSSGSTYLRLSNTTDANGYLGYEGADMVFYTANTDRARITSDGKLLLNTSNTTGRFNISGDIYIFNMSTGAGTNAVKYNAGTGQLTYDTSSAKYKDNIRDSVYGLSHVIQMRSAQFEYKDTGRSDIGFIAEELDLVVPELVMKNQDNEPDSVCYDRMTSVLVKAIQELSAKNDALEARLAALENK